MSFRLRLTLLATGAVALGIAVAAVTLYYTARAQLRGDADRELTARAALIAAALPPRGRRPRAAFLPWFAISRRIQAATTDVPVFLQVDAPDFHLKPRPPLGRLSIPAVVAPAGSWRTVGKSGTDYRVLALPYRRGVVQIARPLTDLERSLHHLRFLLFVVSIGGIALAALLGVIVARAAVEPLRRVVRGIDHVIGTGNLDARIGEGGRDELGELSRRFDQMLRTLERAVDAQRQLVADASHELRTPIAALRANVEVLLAAHTHASDERDVDLRRDIEAQLDRVTELLSELLELARGEEPYAPTSEFRLDELVRDVVDAARPLAPTLSFEVDASPTTIRGRRDRVERAVGNLIDNARKWSPPGASVEIRVEAGVVEVRDHGPGVGAVDRDLIFDRFYRSDTARGTPGSGLGLAIVKQVAEKHGGRISLEETPEKGAGAVFRLDLSRNC